MGPITDDPADRHRVAEVAVGAQHGRHVPFGGGAAFELRDGVGVMLAENLHDS